MYLTTDPSYIRVNPVCHYILKSYCSFSLNGFNMIITFYLLKISTKNYLARLKKLYYKIKKLIVGM